MIDAQLLMNDVSFTAIRSSGPGGQNVNKVSSAALLIWDFKSSHLLTEHQKVLIAEKLPGLVNKEGLLHVKSMEFRDLERNKARCLEKLLEGLKKAFHKPKPRKATKPTRSSSRKRMDSKTKHGDTKKMRQKERF